MSITAAVWMSWWVSTPAATSTWSVWLRSVFVPVSLHAMVVIAVLSLDLAGRHAPAEVSGQDSDGCLLAQAPMRSRPSSGECKRAPQRIDRQILLKTLSQSDAESGRPLRGSLTSSLSDASGRP